MSNRESLQKHVSNMLSLESHILEAIETQAKDDDLQADFEAKQLVLRIKSTLTEHTEHLERHLETLGGHGPNAVKEAVSTALGLAAGLLDKVRPKTVSKMLRDDYTALNLAAMGYTMLHTTARALGDDATAIIARKHLEHLTPIIMDLNEVAPKVVVRELRSDDDLVVDMTVVDSAIRDTQEAWRNTWNNAPEPVA